MMPHTHHGHTKPALQYRWFSTGRDTARLQPAEHAWKHPPNSSSAATSGLPTSADTGLQSVEPGSEPQVPTRQTSPPLLKSP
jgi:hypothetical protein